VVSEVLRDSGVRSLVAVPVPAGDRVLGVLHADSYQLAYFEEGHATLLSLVADRLGGAMEQVRLFESERAARAEAEAVADRLERLQRITVVLSQDLTEKQVAEALLDELSDDIGGAASSHLMWAVEGERMRLLAGATPGSLAEAFAELSLYDELPGPIVARSAEPMWLSSRADIEAFAPLAEAEIRREALAVLPLVVEGKVLGILSVGYPSAHVFDDEDRLFFTVVARQAAESLHRARVRRARSRAAAANALLADVSAALGSSLDAVTTLRRALGEVVPRFADFATFYLLDEFGVPRRVGTLHRDPAVDALVAKAPSEVTLEAETIKATLEAAGGRPLLVPGAGPGGREVVLNPAHAQQLHQLEIGSAIAVPLGARGEVFGMMGLMRLNSSAPFDEEDVELAGEVGLRASDAVDNAMQHERRVAVARALQASLLPPEIVPVPGTEVAALFHPSSGGLDVGGDFYDLFPVDDRRWVLMIGDVSGSGTAAAALTAQVRHGARVAARAGLEPANVVAAVNATLDETTGSEWFCTMVYVELVPHQSGVDLQLICAGHVPPLLVAGGTVEELECQAPLLGVLPGATFTPRRLRLAPGHALLMVTDGATEARSAERRGPDTFFGEERLRGVVAGAAGSDAQGLVDAVADAVLRYAGGQLDDDLALVALRVLPAQNRVQ
jgi:serine phosphatase RsbU (regulator of sigma subunit)/putative methionine-R-sulfoxide reductase with GAF domain